MFRLFKRSRAVDVRQATQLPATEWGPVATGEIASAFLRQLTRTGRFLGALDTRKGFNVTTMTDGSETAMSRDSLSRVDIGPHQVKMTLSGISPQRVAFAALNPVLQSYLSLPSEWRANEQVWTAQVPIRNSVVLAIECHERAADPLAVPPGLAGTKLILELRKLN